MVSQHLWQMPLNAIMSQIWQSLHTCASRGAGAAHSSRQQWEPFAGRRWPTAHYEKARHGQVWTLHSAVVSGWGGTYKLFLIRLHVLVLFCMPQGQTRRVRAGVRTGYAALDKVSTRFLVWHPGGLSKEKISLPRYALS